MPVSYTHLYAKNEGSAAAPTAGLHFTKELLEKVKADGAQLIVVIFHWGNETETVPDSNQTTLGPVSYTHLCEFYLKRAAG